MPPKAKKETSNMSILDQIAADAPEVRVENRNVNVKLGGGAYRAIRQTSAASGISMAEIVRRIVHGQLSADGIDVEGEES